MLEKISERLERLRAARGWTNEQLAVALDLTASMVGLVLAGKRNLGRRSLARLERVELGEEPEPAPKVLIGADPNAPPAEITRAIRQLQQLAVVDKKTADVLVTAIDSNFAMTMKNRKRK